MLSCFAPPAVTLFPSSPVTLFLLSTLRFTLRCRPSLQFIFALLVVLLPTHLQLACALFLSRYSFPSRYFFLRSGHVYLLLAQVRAEPARRGKCLRRGLACVCYRRCLIVRQDRPFCPALGLIVRKLASNPGFPFRIFSRSFGQNPKQKASVRGNWLTVILYSACAW